MKEKLTPFQIALYGFLIFAIIAGVVIFSLRRSTSGENVQTVTAWGTMSIDVFGYLLEEIDDIDRDSLSVEYTEFTPAEYEDAFIEALASGNGPDILFLSSDLLVKHENKLFEISYEFYPQKTFRDTFIEAGDNLLTETGVIGLPYTVDPLVLYWNRTMLNAAGISQPPTYWDQFTEIAPRLSKVDENLNISKTAISFGEFRNVRHAKDIILTLIRQAGNPVVSRNTDPDTETKFDITLDERLGYALRPADAALNFYTQFSNPTLDTYSWNRSMPNSQDVFLAGDAAFYVGYASEYMGLQKKNPNLNFDVAVLPQSRSNDGNISVNGKMVFAGLVKNSPNPAAGFDALMKLTSKQNIGLLSDLTNLPPVRRDLLVDRNESAVLETFYRSALITKPFLEPSAELTDKVFSDMIESYTSGRSTLSEVLVRAQSQLKDLFKQNVTIN